MLTVAGMIHAFEGHYKAVEVRDAILSFFRTRSLRAIKSDMIQFARLGPAFEESSPDA